MVDEIATMNLWLYIIENKHLEIETLKEQMNNLIDGLKEYEHSFYKGESEK
jgi:hypothetical protein